MTWKCSVSRDWLMAKSSFLDTSLIQEMLPFTKSGRRRPLLQLDAARLKAWGRTQTDYIRDDECELTGAEARERILTAPAINLFTRYCHQPMKPWHDTVVNRKGSVVGWSPCGLNVKQEAKHGSIVFESELEADEMCTVRCYSIEKHISKQSELKSKHEERWEIATAFYVMPRLQRGYLIFFNPDVTPMYRLCVESYWRSDLKAEIAMIEDVVNEYRNFTPVLGGTFTPEVHCPHSEVFQIKSELKN